MVLAAAALAGVDEVWRIGGAQAIAALAYGTGRIAAVDVVTGPGNAWVAEAKRQLYGVVGIDMVAGPSEIVVVADGKQRSALDRRRSARARPSMIRPASRSCSPTILRFADAVAAAVERRTRHARHRRYRARPAGRRTARSSPCRRWRTRFRCATGWRPSISSSRSMIRRRLFDEVRHAGSVFLGRHTPEAVGDYVAGPNHVLPTGRRARFASGLSVLDFMKRTSFLALDEAGLGRDRPGRGDAGRCRGTARARPLGCRTAWPRLSAADAQAQ